MGRNWAEFLGWGVGGGGEASSTYPFPPAGPPTMVDRTAAVPLLP